MATPITWQNINAPSLADASRPLEAAQRSFSGMFGQLGDMITQREGLNEKNWQNTKVNNTQAFLDKVASYRTPEELAAAQQSGALNQMRSQFGAQIDPNAVRGADEQRMVALRNQTKQGFEYDNVLKDQRSQPFMDAYKVAAQKGDKLAMAAAEQSYNQAGGRDLAGLVTFADNTGWQKEQQGEERTDWGRKAQDQVWQGEKQVADLAHQRAQEAIARGQLAVSQGGLGIQREELALRRGEGEERRQEKLSKQLTETALARSKLKDTSLNSPEGQETVAKYIRDNYKDPNTAASLLAKANKVAQTGFTKDGKDIPVTVGAMLQAIGATEDTRWGITKFANDSDQADYVQPNLEKVLLSNAYQESLSKQTKQSTSLDSELDRLKSRITMSSSSSKSSGPSGLSGKAKVGETRRIEDGSTYQYTKAGWVRQY